MLVIDGAPHPPAGACPERSRRGGCGKERGLYSQSNSVLIPVRPIFRAVAATVVPEAAALDDAAWLDLEAAVEHALRQRPPQMRRQLRIFLRAVQWWPLLRHGKRFTALTPATRTRFLSHLQEHRIEAIRVGFWGLRTLALLGYYGRSQARDAIGYRPDRRGWEARA